MAETSRGRAVVVGASMGGLLAARTLADHFEEVVVVERDPLPTDTRARRGVPQGRQQFPGFLDEVVEAGGLLGDLMEHGRYVFNGGTIVSYRSGLAMLCASRPLLESVTRDRVRTLPNVGIRDASVATGLTHRDGDVTGILLRPAAGQAGERDEQLPAELVVIATGRGAATVRWLADLGIPEPPTQQVEVGIT